MRTKIICLICIICCLTSYAAKKEDSFQTPGGKTVTIHHIKHATMYIEYDGKHIFVDPVGEMEPKTDFSNYPKANICLITHEHHDHFDPLALAKLCSSATAVYANPAVRGQMSRGIAMHNGDSITLSNDLKIFAVPAYNTTEGREKFHPKGRDNGYILSLDGLRIYIAGDTEDIPEMADIKDIDIAFLPCNQPYTMTIDQLIRAANIIKPKVLFPYHYSDTPINQLLLKMAGSDISVRIRDYK